MSVRTGTHRYVPTCTMIEYVPVRTTWKMSHDGTYQYIQVRTSTGKNPKVRTRTYLTAYKAVQGSTGRYMGVHEMVQGGTGWYMALHDMVQGSTWLYMSVHVKFHQSTRQYMEVHVSTLRLSAFAPGGGPGEGAADFGARLKALNCLHQQWLLLQVIACTNSFIHPWHPCPRLPCHRPPPCHPRRRRRRLAMLRQAPRQPRPLVAAS